MEIAQLFGTKNHSLQDTNISLPCHWLQERSLRFSWPTLLCCILLAGSHTVASTCHSEHLLLHPFDSFAVRAGDVKDVNFILHLVWCTNNIQTWIKTPLSSPELCKANKVIFSRRDSQESGGSREKAVAIIRCFLFKVQVKMSVISLLEMRIRLA